MNTPVKLSARVSDTEGNFQVGDVVQFDLIGRLDDSTVVTESARTNDSGIASTLIIPGNDAQFSVRARTGEAETTWDIRVIDATTGSICGS